MKSLTFSCLICALNCKATKPIFCSKVAQKCKAPGCQNRKNLLQTPKVLKSCQAQSGKAYPGLIHYVALICENVSLDWSTMQLVGNYGCQQNARSGSGPGVYLLFKEYCFRVRVRVRDDTNPNPNITLILTLKQYSLNKEIDPDLGPGRDPAFY